MRNFLLLFLLLMPVIGSCTDDYDDSAAWKDIDGIYKDLDQLKEKLNSLQLQANALSQIVKGGAITSVTEAANGGYVISYKGSDNVEHSFTIATTDQMVSSPIIGIQEEAVFDSLKNSSSMIFQPAEIPGKKPQRLSLNLEIPS